MNTIRTLKFTLPLLALLLPVLAFSQGFGFYPAGPSAVNTRVTTGGTTTVLLTSGSSWTVPADWNNADNTIEAIGGGAGGGSWTPGDEGRSSIFAGARGGDGEYSKVSNVALAPGTRVSYSVGEGGLGAGPPGNYECSGAVGPHNGSGTFGRGDRGGDTAFGDVSCKLVNFIGRSCTALVYATGGMAGGGASYSEFISGRPTIPGRPDNGINGQSYGEGGGGGGATPQNETSLPGCPVGGAGAPGVIVITYTPATPPASSAPTCSVTFDQNPLTGDSTTMHWTSTGADLFYINNVGYVGASGTSQIFSTGDYSGTVSGAGGTASCHARLAGPGDNANGNGSSCTPAARTCNATTGVITDNCGDTTACANGCSTATNQCILPSCPVGFRAEDGQCVRVTCLDGWTLSGSVCIPPANIAFEEFDAFDRNGNPFRATGHLQAFPPLVRQGDTTRLYWQVSNARSCTVTGTNGDSWAARNSGASGETSSGITAQTIYTLQCQALLGATPPTVQETVIVNILPLFEEI